MSELTYEKAIEVYGSPRGIAEALGIKVQAVYQWAGKIPALRKYQLIDLMRREACNQNAAQY